MNSSNQEAPAMGPAPGMEAAPAEQAPQGAAAESAPAGAPEQGPPAVAERAPAAPQASQAAPAIPLPPLPPAPLAASPAQSSAPAGSTATPATADDGDLIEREWVDKAKQIVEHTRDDPHKQSEELTMVKADYLQKRYNKTIKLSN